MFMGTRFPPPGSYAGNADALRGKPLWPLAVRYARADISDATRLAPSDVDLERYAI